MAKSDVHFALLKQGVTVWNEWRDKNPDVRPELANVILQEADLRGAVLERADLSRAFLLDVKLSGQTSWERT
jgi:uncharacterized protein YjbI with pentapeptide repeats